MIVDVRIYNCVPGRMAEWVALYEAEAWPVQRQYLGRCLGWYTSLEGSLHRIVHIWEYDSQADRETRRAAMAQDPAWRAFAEKAATLGAFVSQENSIMRAVPFFAISNGR